MTAASVPSAEHGPSLWTARLAPTTLGIFALAFVLAFESLAVATVMPQVAVDLGGLSLYALAFAAPAAVSVIALALAGPWMDRRGTGLAFCVGIGTFIAGLLLAGLATSMPAFLIGRGVQGFGGGIVGVGIYVLVATVYDEQLRPRAFALLTGAWVLPGFIGPYLAAQVAHAFGWRWVFLGVPVIAAAALALLAGSIRRPAPTITSPAQRHRIGWAIGAASGVLVLSVAGQRTSVWWPLLLAAGIVLVVVSGPRLLPKGSWLGGRGLPSVIGARGLIAAGYGAAEAYLPLALIRFRDVSPVQAGAALTAAAVAWFGGAWVGSHLKALADDLLRLRLGLVLVTLGVSTSLGVLVDTIPVLVMIGGWALAGLGMGLAYPTLSVLVLKFSPADSSGASSSAAQINDSVVVALALAVGSIAFAALIGVDPALAVGVVLSLAAVLLAAAWLPLTRIGRPAAGPTTDAD